MIDYEFLGNEKEGEVIAVRDAKRVGRLTFEVIADACLIKYLFVAPSARRCGIATMLILEMYDRVFGSGITEVSILLPHEDASLEAFFKKLEYQRDDSFGEYNYFTVGDVINGPTMKKTKELSPETFMPLRSVRSPGVINAFGKVLKRAGYESDTRAFFSEFDASRSMILMSGGEVHGFAAIGNISEGEIFVSQIYIDPEEKDKTMGFIKALAVTIREALGEACVVGILTSTDEERSVVKRIVEKEHIDIRPLIRYYIEISDEED